MPDGLKFISPKRTLLFAGSLTSEVTTPCATAILFCTAQLLPNPGQSELLLQVANGDELAVLRRVGLEVEPVAALAPRLAVVRVVTPRGGMMSTKLPAHELLSTTQLL